MMLLKYHKLKLPLWFTNKINSIFRLNESKVCYKKNVNNL